MLDRCRASCWSTGTPPPSAGRCSRPSAPRESPLRHQEATASCHYGGHRIWWEVEAETEGEAIARLPGYVADRTTITRVRWTDIP